MVSRKIKITATLDNNRSEHIIPRLQEGDVEYQWHWTRVFVALLVLVLLVTAIISVFPDDSPKPDSEGFGSAIITLSTQNSVNKKADIKAIKTDTVFLSQYEKVKTQEGAPTLTTESSVTVDTVAQTERVKTQEGASILTTESSVTVDTVAQTERVKTQGVAPTLTTESPVTVNTVAQTASLPNEKSEEVEALEPEVENVSPPDNALGINMDTNMVSRALLTRAIKAREPVDLIGEKIERASFTKRLYFFTEVIGLKGKSVRHKWYFQDRLQADVALSVYADRFRTYSSKNIAALQLGVWRVEIVAEDRILARKQFIVTDR